MTVVISPLLRQWHILAGAITKVDMVDAAKAAGDVDTERGIRITCQSHRPAIRGAMEHASGATATIGSIGTGQVLGVGQIPGQIPGT